MPFLFFPRDMKIKLKHQDVTVIKSTTHEKATVEIYNRTLG